MTGDQKSIPADHKGILKIRSKKILLATSSRTKNKTPRTKKATERPKQSNPRTTPNFAEPKP